MSVIITKEYLQTHSKHIFVFGDNTKRFGDGGAARLRHEANSYGFITKIYPDNCDESFYRPQDYIMHCFLSELEKLSRYISINPDKTFLISQLGSGLANRYHIWEKVIKLGLELLRNYNNVIFLWEIDELPK